MYKIYSTLLIVLSLFATLNSFNPILAAEEGKVEYINTPVLDSDLDGLTDEGEKKIFKTDPNFPDTDNDGFFDGAEVIGQSDPLDSNSPTALQSYKSSTYPEETETPWGWYSTRATGLVAYFLLFVAFFAGAVKGIPKLREWCAYICDSRMHCWLSLHASIFSIFHVISLFFGPHLQFSFIQVFVPFMAPEYQIHFFLGQIALFLILAMTISSYLMKFIPYRAWRIVHFSSLILLFIAMAHTLSFGSDVKEGSVGRVIFISANAVLLVLLLINMFFKIRTAYIRKAIASQANQTSIR